MTVDNSSNRPLHCICGSLLIALLLIFDGGFSTLLKCSAQLSKMASLSVRSVLPSALRIGEVGGGGLQNYLGHKLFSVHHGTSFHIRFVCKRLDFV